MRLSITNAITDITTERFENMLLNEGAFPEVKFEVSKTPQGVKIKSYSLFEYSDIYARFMKLLDKLMKEKLDPTLGVFTRKHSKDFLAEVREICNDITEPDVLSFGERFRSFADSVRGYADEQVANGNWS